MDEFEEIILADMVNEATKRELIKAEKNTSTKSNGLRYDIKYPIFTESELKNNVKKVLSMKSVCDLNGTEFDGDNKISERIDNYFNSLNNKVYSEELGDVSLSKTSRRSEIRHGLTINKISAFVAIPDVIQSGKVISDITKADIERIVVAAPITINGERYYMGVMLQRDMNTQRLYLHDVITEKETEIKSSEHLNTTGPIDNNNNLFFTRILQKLLSVNNNISNNSKNGTKHSLSPNDNKSYSDFAEKFFGTTHNWNETGYLLKNGKKLDFSGKNEGAPAGSRSVDHRDINSAFYDVDTYIEEGRFTKENLPDDRLVNQLLELDGTEAMIDFMNRGNIRIMPETNGINLSVEPSKSQYEALGDFVSKKRGEVMLDIDDENGNTIFSMEYPRGTYYSKVINDIKNYFSEGTVPQKSVVSDFYMRFSLSEDYNLSEAFDKTDGLIYDDNGIKLDKRAYRMLQSNLMTKLSRNISEKTDLPEYESIYSDNCAYYLKIHDVTSFDVICQIDVEKCLSTRDILRLLRSVYENDENSGEFREGVSIFEKGIESGGGRYSGDGNNVLYGESNDSYGGIYEGGIRKGNSDQREDFSKNSRYSADLLKNKFSLSPEECGIIGDLDEFEEIIWADIVVEIASDNTAVLYDIVSIKNKKITEPLTTSTTQNVANRRNSSVTNSSISQKNTFVNTSDNKFSLSPEEREILGDLDEFEEIIGSDDVKDIKTGVSEDVIKHPEKSKQKNKHPAILQGAHFFRKYGILSMVEVTGT